MMARRRDRRRAVRVGLALAAAAALTSCSSGGWFGDKDPPPLPGERIAVLADTGGVEVDPDLADRAPALPDATANNRWPQAGGTAAHAPGHLALDEGLRQLWRASVGRGNGDRQRLLTAPVVADGRIYAVDAGAVAAALDAATGRTVWRTDLAPEDEREGGIGGGVAVDGDVVVAATGYAEVLALEPATGAIRWRSRVSAPVRSAPTVADGRVFVVSSDNRTHALSLADGSPLWTHSGLGEVAGLQGGASPAAADGVVVAPYSSGEVYALRADNGSVLWIESMAALARTDAVARLTDIRALPVMSDGRVYVIGNSNMAAAIDLRSGRRAWDLAAGGLQTPWLAGDVLFILTHGGRLAALDANSGRAYWTAELPPGMWHGPVLAGGRVVLAGAEGELLLLSPADGTVLGRTPLPGTPAAAPVIAGGTLYVMTESGDIVAYR